MEGQRIPFEETLKSGPVVGIIMGSDSDLPVMAEAAKILERFEIPHEVRVVSAHRTADRMVQYAHAARPRGMRAIIAGAGGAAHLQGMTAANTIVPVYGVPTLTSALNGVDSLYSVVQMPGGIPVATFAIDGAKNAALQAVEQLATTDSRLADMLEDYRSEMAREVELKDALLQEIGYKEYLKRMQEVKEGNRISILE